VTADLNVTGEFAYIAARLVDVDPGTNTKTLVARGGELPDRRECAERSPDLFDLPDRR
jgi:hypothetical protein